MSDAQAPAPGAGPSRLRIALGLLAGWAAATALGSALAAAAIAATTPDPYSAQQQTVFGIAAIAAGFGLVALIGGPAVFALLLRAGRRGWAPFLLGGLAAGAILGAAAPLAAGSAFNAASVGVLAAAGGVQILISRAVAGVRRG